MLLQLQLSFSSQILHLFLSGRHQKEKNQPNDYTVPAAYAINKCDSTAANIDVNFNKTQFVSANYLRTHTYNLHAFNATQSFDVLNELCYQQLHQLQEIVLKLLVNFDHNYINEGDDEINAETTTTNWKVNLCKLQVNELENYVYTCLCIHWAVVLVYKRMALIWKSFFAEKMPQRKQQQQISAIYQKPQRTRGHDEKRAT